MGFCESEVNLVYTERSCLKYRPPHQNQSSPRQCLCFCRETASLPLLNTMSSGPEWTCPCHALDFQSRKLHTTPFLRVTGFQCFVDSNRNTANLGLLLHQLSCPCCCEEALWSFQDRLWKHGWHRFSVGCYHFKHENKVLSHTDQVLIGFSTDA